MNVRIYILITVRGNLLIACESKFNRTIKEGLWLGYGYTCDIKINIPEQIYISNF